MVHDVLIWWLFEPIDRNASKIIILNILDKLKFFLKHIFFLNRNVISHMIIIYNRLSSDKKNQNIFKIIHYIIYQIKI